MSEKSKSQAHLEPSQEPGKVVIISGPSGSGKSTICKALTQHPKAWLSVSATTRPRRPHEEDGRHYYFLTRDEFEKWIEEKRFVEYAQVIDNYYGTPLEPVEEKVKEGRICLLDIDIEGQHIIKEKNIECLSIFILPPSMEILEKRLRHRRTEREEQIQKRLNRAKKEIENASNYEYQVVNDDLTNAIEEVCQIIGLPVGDWLKVDKIKN